MPFEETYEETDMPDEPDTVLRLTWEEPNPYPNSNPNHNQVLRLTWEEPPTRAWYEGRPLPLFNVRLTLALPHPYPYS